MSDHFDLYFRCRKELDIIRNKSAVLSGIFALDCSTTSMATLVSVIALVLTGRPLTPVNVFTMISFISTLKKSICFYLANALQQTFDAYASLARIEDFLLSDVVDSSSETDSSATLKTNKHSEHLTVNQHISTTSSTTATILRVSRLTKEHDKREDESILQDIEFTVQSGALAVITGPVGSGKSTLLSAIAGEVPDSSGEISCNGTLVYVPQAAWVFSGTVRENILFGEPYDETKYTRTIEACALTEDIQQFPDRDQTVVGERGAILSGGQRARVSLARAVYADADIYLLDDPLSAVDFKVGKHIFEKCIKGLLSHKTLVVTSHQELHMQDADEVIVLYKGRVLGKGNFTELKQTGILTKTIDPLFKKLGNNESEYNTNQEEEEEEEEEETDKVSDRFGKSQSNTTEDQGLQISEEDRAIGKVSSKLYWNYFRSGVSSLMLIALICLCLLTQGKSGYCTAFSVASSTRTFTSFF